MVSIAQQKATQKYNKNNYDRLELVIPKGKKDELKQVAKDNGDTVNTYIIKCINNMVGCELIPIPQKQKDGK